MTAVFSTWQISRLGLRISPSGCAALTSLLVTLGASGQTKQPLRTSHSLCRGSKHTQGARLLAEGLDLAHVLRPRTSLLRHHLRWVSLLKQGLESEENAGEEQGEQLNLTVDEVKKIFGKSMDPEEGVEVLTEIQTHRLEGTLDLDMAYPDIWIVKGLAYLRAKFPLDEDAAIIARIDREIENVEINYQSRSAVSQFDKLVRENKLRSEREARKRKAEEKKAMKERGRVEGGMLQTRDGKATAAGGKLQTRDGKATAVSKGLVRPREAPEWVKKYRDAATEKEFTNITNVQRVVPSAIFVTVVLVLCYLFVQNYNPPSREARLFPDIPPAAATVSALIGANVIVAVMWRIPQFWAFCNKTFIIAPIRPRAKTMLGAAFSHHHFQHLCVNMFGLWLVGTRVHNDLGRGPFLALYFGSAVLGGFIPMAVYVTKNIFATTTLGASGAICGLIAAFCVLHEGQTIQLAFLPPEWTQGIDTGLVLAMVVFWEILGLRRVGLQVPKMIPNIPQAARVDYMGHLAGYAAGIGGAAIIRATDPKWGNAKREHWYQRNSEKVARQ